MLINQAFQCTGGSSPDWGPIESRTSSGQFIHGCPRDHLWHIGGYQHYLVGDHYDPGCGYDTDYKYPLTYEYVSVMPLRGINASIYWDFYDNLKKPEVKNNKGDSKIARKSDLMLFYQILEQSLDESNFFKVKERKKVIFQKIKNIFSKTELTHVEVKTLISIIKNIKK